MTEVKKRLDEKLLYDSEGFRMSTPPLIAEYKAERLKADSIADLGAGIGIQSLNFALVSKRVVVVENNSERIEACRKNAGIMGLTNIEFIASNALDKSTVEMIGDVEVVHSDPSRQKSADRWSFSDLSPNPMEILKLYKSDNVSFDLPASMSPSLIPSTWELEYISLQGELKRLSVYLGGAKRFERSAITLPSKTRVVGDKDLTRKVEIVDRPSKWIYDLDGSLSNSDLVPEYLREDDRLSLLHQDRQKTLLTSDKLIENPFLIKSYSLLESARSIQELRRRLLDLNAKSVFIRYSVDPSQYYEMRRVLEKDLQGEKQIFVFKIKDILYLAERVEKVK
jgi:hypothetical protein